MVCSPVVQRHLLSVVGFRRGGCRFALGVDVVHRREDLAAMLVQIRKPSVPIPNRPARLFHRHFVEAVCDALFGIAIDRMQSRVPFDTLLK